jgi:hypothetical protein
MTYLMNVILAANIPRVTTNKPRNILVLHIKHAVIRNFLQTFIGAKILITDY